MEGIFLTSGPTLMQILYHHRTPQEKVNCGANVAHRSGCHRWQLEQPLFLVLLLEPSTCCIYACMPALEALGGASAVFATMSIALQLADVAVRLHTFWNHSRTAPRRWRTSSAISFFSKGCWETFMQKRKCCQSPTKHFQRMNRSWSANNTLRNWKLLRENCRSILAKGKYKGHGSLSRLSFRKMISVDSKEIWSRWRLLSFSHGNLWQGRRLRWLLVFTFWRKLRSMLSMHQHNIFASCVSSFLTQQLETARAMRAMETQVQKDTSVIIDTLQATSNSALPKPVLSTLESTINLCVKKGFKESSQDLQARFEQ